MKKTGCIFLHKIHTGQITGLIFITAEYSGENK